MSKLMPGLPPVMRKAGLPSVLASHQMALVDLTKQLAKEALLSATQDPKPPAPPTPAAENMGAIVMGQVNSMQKALKEVEELGAWCSNSSEILRVIVIFLPSPQLAGMAGHVCVMSLHYALPHIV